LGWKTLGYVEWNDFCQRLIAQRIQDGILDDAPIFSDIKTFIDEGFADSYKGLVDVVSGGFPCQPFSMSGQRKKELDSRNMWPETFEVIGKIRPKFAFLENVSGLISTIYFGRILADISSIGYDCRWCLVGGDNVGAPHERKRLWILAYSHEFRSDSICQWEYPDNRNLAIDYPPFPLFNWNGIEFEEPSKMPREAYTCSPLLCRMDDGLADKLDRIKAIGNGQIPSVVELAWKILTRGLKL
jgi:DNA (cytosine-5)-methyltransferase 1